MWNNIVKEAESKMKKTADSTRHELSLLRTGRANPNILDAVRVQYYGAPTPLKQLATISTPEPRMILIQPFDINSIKEIEKAIQAADLGLQPMIDGKILRITIPPLTKERREELVKIVKKVAEDGRVSVRNIRRDANEQIKKLEKEKKITEDDSSNAKDQIQKMTDRHIHQLDEAAGSKETELLTA